MLLPNGELVAKAWILGVPGIPAHSVATTLPEDRSTWAASGFIRVTAFPSTPELHVQKRMTVIDIESVFQAKEGSDKPPWNKAAQNAEKIFNATYDDDALFIQRRLILPTAYDDARVLTVIPGEPERRGEDPDSNAIYGMAATFNWIRVPK